MQCLWNNLADACRTGVPIVTMGTRTCLGLQDLQTMHSAHRNRYYAERCAVGTNVVEGAPMGDFHIR